jgi:hypothetical protein
MRRRGKREDGVLTVDAIKRQYRSEWILLADPEVDEELRVLAGRVVSHSKDRDEVDRKAIQLRLKRSAFLYTGECLEDMEYVLWCADVESPAAVCTNIN